MTAISSYLTTWNVTLALAVVLLPLLVWGAGVVRYIPNSRIGVAEKLW